MQIFKVLIGTSCLCWKGNDILPIKTILTVGSPNRVSRCELRDGIISAPFIKVGPVYLLLNKVWKKDWNSFFFFFFLSTVGHFLSLFLKKNKKQNMLSCSFVAAVDDKQKKSRRKSDFIGIKVKKKITEPTRISLFQWFGHSLTVSCSSLQIELRFRTSR